MSEKKIIRLKATATYKGSTQTASVNITPYTVKDAYFATKTEEIIYDTEKGSEQTYKVVSGDYLSKIAKKFSTTVAKIKEDNALTKNNLNIGQSLTIKGVDIKKEKGKNITFEPLTKASVGDEVYIVVDTKSLEGETITAKIHQGKEKVLAEVDKAITVLHNNSEAYEFSAVVGALADDDTVLNKDDLKQLAVMKVTLSPKKDEDFKKWNDAIEKQTDKKTHLFLYVKADIDDIVKYCGGNNENDQDYEQRFGNTEGQWLELYENKLPPWMEIAWKEYNEWSSKKWTEKKDDGLTRANSYIKKAGYSFKANIKAWCACFVDWTLKETNSTKKTKYSTIPRVNEPSSSLNYWYLNRYPNSTQIKPSLDFPPYGVIVVLVKDKAEWEGHVGFLINFKETGSKKYAYLLGGNQNDKVCIQEFEVYKKGSEIKYETKKGSVYSLAGYVYPKEYKIDANKKYKNDYKTKGYTVEQAISTR